MQSHKFPFKCYYFVVVVFDRFIFGCTRFLIKILILLMVLLTFSFSVFLFNLYSFRASLADMRTAATQQQQAATNKSSSAPRSNLVNNAQPIGTSSAPGFNIV